jgi:hypothetical protein
MPRLGIFISIVLMVTVTCVILCIAMSYVHRYIIRAKARNEGIFRDDRRINDWR